MATTMLERTRQRTIQRATSRVWPGKRSFTRLTLTAATRLSNKNSTEISARSLSRWALTTWLMSAEMTKLSQWWVQSSRNSNSNFHDFKMCICNLKSGTWRLGGGRQVNQSFDWEGLRGQRVFSHLGNVFQWRQSMDLAGLKWEMHIKYLMG